MFAHAQTGNALKDHTDHVIWLGPSETLKLSALSRPDPRRGSLRERIAVADRAALPGDVEARPAWVYIFPFRPLNRMTLTAFAAENDAGWCSW